MLLKLALLLSGICAISPEVVEIECSSNSYNCIVEEIPEELPANATWKFLCPQNCTRIRMTNTNFTRFPRELWNTHPQVTDLYLTDTDFEELAFGDFFNAAKLNIFILNYNKKFMSLRNNCFWGAFELISIDLYANTISEVEDGAFNGIPRLDQLGMQYNNISYINNNHFRNLPNLHYLFLFFNIIETIESEAFLHNTNLNYLNIDSNNLKEVDLLLPFTNTGTISFYGNQLTKVALRSTSSDFEEFDNGAFLYLENNQLTQLYIQPNFAVQALILWQNPIEQLDLLPKLRSVEILNLQWCEIKSLDGQRFADKYVNLKSLHISGNNLTSFSKETFAGLDKLATLVLEVNQLTELDFPRMESLVYLDLKNNSLTEFPFGDDIRDTFPALTTLNIRNNYFDEEYLAELVKTLTDQEIYVSWEPVPW